MTAAKPWTDEQDALIRKMLDEGFTYSHVAKTIGFSTSHTHRRIIDLGLAGEKYLPLRKQKQLKRIKEGLLEGVGMGTLAKELECNVRTVRYLANRMLRQNPELKEQVYKANSTKPATRVLSLANKKAIEEINRVWSSKGLPYRAWWDFTEAKIVSDIPVKGAIYETKTTC